MCARIFDYLNNSFFKESWNKKKIRIEIKETLYYLVIAEGVFDTGFDEPEFTYK